jgi:hypothetical protein
MIRRQDVRAAEPLTDSWCGHQIGSLFPAVSLRVFAFAPCPSVGFGFAVVAVMLAVTSPLGLAWCEHHLAVLAPLDRVRPLDGGGQVEN